MQEFDAENLLNKYRSGEATPRERAIVEEYIEMEGIIPRDLMEIEAELNINKEEVKKIGTTQKTMPLPLRILLVAASIAVVATMWTVLFTDKVSNSERYSNDINPGGNKALLTLDNGKKIQLSDTKSGILIDASKLTYNDGTLIGHERSKTFTISTPRGGTYQIVLPDGSKVWLNAASSLVYGIDLVGGREVRKVSLNGEAYFEVFKNKKQPFVVSSKKMELTVLGTHFNLNAYDDELDTKATLLEGSVKVKPLISGPGERILKPDQQAVITSSGSLKVAEVDASIEIAWKDGEFSFRNEPLEEIMKRIARWYDVDVVYENSKVREKLFGGSISRFEKVSQVFYLLEAAGSVKFKIEGKKVTVSD